MQLIRVPKLLARWVCALAVVLCVAAPAAAQSSTKYTTSVVRLRAQPSADARALARIPRGAAVRVGDCERSWCEVTYRGQSGYAAERYLGERRTAAQTAGSRRASGGGEGGGDGYVNSRGERVRSPAHSPSGPPPGASAQCRDGTYSFSRSRRGTCSHHGGVARWL